MMLSNMLWVGIHVGFCTIGNVKSPKSSYRKSHFVICKSSIKFKLDWHFFFFSFWLHGVFQFMLHCVHVLSKHAIWKLTTMVPFQVQHKLNYFLICWIFWILIMSYDENLKNSCNKPSWSLNLSEWLLAILDWSSNHKALKFSFISIWLW